MKLELANFPVKEVKFNGRTSYQNGVLEINKDELVKLVLEDKRVESADLDIALPGEQTRIVRVREVVEPRIKISGPGCVFPGIMGPPETVGEGKTNRLSGATVMASGTYKGTIPTGTGSENSGLVDMWGPGSQATPFGSTINIVLLFNLVDGVTEIEAQATIQMATFKVAHRLAETTIDKTPENVEVFELPEVDPSLPRVVYNLCAYTEWHTPHPTVAFYGLPLRESLPTFIHPNELLDGAMTTDARHGHSSRIVTWQCQNHPIVLALFKEHGKRLNFLGVILQRTRFEAQLGKQVTAQVASQMARLLGAEGAILSRIVPSGNNFMDVMFTLQAYEKKGMKTVLITPEEQGSSSVLVASEKQTVRHPGAEIPLPFYVPEATAMVTVSELDSWIKLPVPNKVIGCAKGETVILMPGDPAFDPMGEVTFRTWQDITGGMDWWGGMRFRSKDY